MHTTIAHMHAGHLNPDEAAVLILVELLCRRLGAGKVMSVIEEYELICEQNGLPCSSLALLAEEAK